MSAPGIIPLLKQYRAKEISGAEMTEKMDGIVALLERKIEALKHVKIIAADQEEWNTYLRPGLELSYQGLIGAARMCQEYVKTPTQEVAETIVFALHQVEKASTFVESRLGGVATETRQVIEDELAAIDKDNNQIGQIKNGHAQAAISLFDD